MSQKIRWLGMLQHGRLGNVFRESEGKKSVLLSKRRWEEQNSKVGLKEVRREFSDLSVSD